MSPFSVNRAFDDVASLIFFTSSVAVVSAKEGSLAFAGASLETTTAFLVTGGPNAPFQKYAVHGARSLAAILGFSWLTVAVLSSEEGSLAVTRSGSGAAAAGLAALLPVAPFRPFAVDGTFDVVASLGFPGFTDARLATVGNLRA